MKKFIPTFIVSIVVVFVAGCQCGYHGCESKYRVIKANANTTPYKIELIKAREAALKAADKVMDNNQLFDTDGSDAMADYLHKASVVDSLNKLEQQALAYCSCLLLLCLREHKEHL